MNSLYPILRKVLVQVTKIATTVLLLIVLIDYFEKLIAFKFESVYEGTDGYYYLYTPISFTIAEYIQISFITSLFLLILSISLRFCLKRGLFRSASGKLINADLNGAIGILRKVVGERLWQIADRGVVGTPSRIQFL